MLQYFHNTHVVNNSGRPTNQNFGYNGNGVEMAGDTYLLNTTLCWVFNVRVLSKTGPLVPHMYAAGRKS